MGFRKKITIIVKGSGVDYYKIYQALRNLIYPCDVEIHTEP